MLQFIFIFLSLSSTYADEVRVNQGEHIPIPQQKPVSKVDPEKRMDEVTAALRKVINSVEDTKANAFIDKIKSANGYSCQIRRQIKPLKNGLDGTLLTSISRFECKDALNERLIDLSDTCLKDQEVIRIVINTFNKNVNQITTCSKIIDKENVIQEINKLDI